MDPQKLSQLDPKLRDAYQRVMGTSVPPPQAPPPSPPPPTPTPTPAPVQDSVSTVQEPSPIPTPEPTIPQPTEPTAAATNFDQMKSEVATNQPQAQTAVVKKKSAMPILMVIGAICFIVIYTLVWTKIFNFKLPFLP